MMWGWNYGWGMGFGWIGMIIFWVLAVLAVVFLVQAAARQGAGRGDEPLNILKRRYAKGEITREEFERMKDDLKKS